MIITIIGLGLIGGSLALDLRKRGFASHIIGVDRSVSHEEYALDHGIVDEIKDLQTAVELANLVVLAIPVNAAITLLPKILHYADKETWVTDMGSTKWQLIEAIKDHPKRANFVASHPMAGTEHSGPTAAIYNLFDNKVAIICDENSSNPTAVMLVKEMYSILNMRLIQMEAQAHDTHAAYVSHISHISSFILANTVLDKEKNDAAIFNLASGGFDSTVRLAKSSPQMWSQIFEQNSENVLEVMDTYIQHLQNWRDLIAAGKFKDLEEEMAKANTIRKVLNTPHVERVKTQ